MTIKLINGLGNINEELKTMVGWLNDPEIVRYSEQRHKKHDIESQYQYIIDHPGVFRTIWADDNLIGTISAYIDRPNSIADVGILIGDKHIWGKGYGTEAWTTFCDSLFETGIRKIEAGCMVINKGMFSICKKYKMRCEGIKEAHFMVSGTKVDMIMWGKFRG